MHWSLIAMIALVAATALVNAAAWRITGQCRSVGLALAAGWAVQQTVWWQTGADSLVLFGLCDAVILAVLWRSRPGWHFTDAAIVLLLVTGWIVRAEIERHGLTAPLWWAGRALVAAQLVLALPWPVRQRIHHTVSHGPLRAGSILP